MQQVDRPNLTVATNEGTNVKQDVPTYLYIDPADKNNSKNDLRMAVEFVKLTGKEHGHRVIVSTKKEAQRMQRMGVGTSARVPTSVIQAYKDVREASELQDSLDLEFGVEEEDKKGNPTGEEATLNSKEDINWAEIGGISSVGAVGAGGLIGAATLSWNKYQALKQKYKESGLEDAVQAARAINTGSENVTGVTEAGREAYNETASDEAITQLKTHAAEAQAASKAAHEAAGTSAVRGRMDAVKIFTQEQFGLAKLRARAAGNAAIAAGKEIDVKPALDLLDVSSRQFGMEVPYHNSLMAIRSGIIMYRKWDSFNKVTKMFGLDMNKKVARAVGRRMKAAGESVVAKARAAGRAAGEYADQFYEDTYRLDQLEIDDVLPGDIGEWTPVDLDPQDPIPLHEPNVGYDVPNDPGGDTAVVADPTAPIDGAGVGFTTEAPPVARIDPMFEGGNVQDAFSDDEFADALEEMPEPEVAGQEALDTLREVSAQRALRPSAAETPHPASRAGGISGGNALGKLATTASHGAALIGAGLAVDQIAPNLGPGVTHDVATGGLGAGIIGVGTAGLSVLGGATVATAASGAAAVALPLVPATIAAGATHRAVANAAKERLDLNDADANLMAAPVGAAIFGTTAWAVPNAVAATYAAFSAPAVTAAAISGMSVGDIGLAALGVMSGAAEAAAIGAAMGGIIAAGVYYGTGGGSHNQFKQMKAVDEVRAIADFDFMAQSHITLQQYANASDTDLDRLAQMNFNFRTKALGYAGMIDETGRGNEVWQNVVENAAQNRQFARVRELRQEYRRRREAAQKHFNDTRQIAQGVSTVNSAGGAVLNSGNQDAALDAIGGFNDAFGQMLRDALAASRASNNP